MSSPVFIVGYARTPFGAAFTGQLSHLSASELGGHAIKGCLDRVKADNPTFQGISIDQVILGHVVSAGCGQAPATQALHHASLPTSIPAFTVNKVCASGMKAVTLGNALIQAGEAECIIAGGMESMSAAPFALPTGLRCPNRGLRYGNAQMTDLLALDGLTDAFCKLPMGEAAERVADKYSFSREQMEAYAKSTFERAIASEELFKSHEIVPIAGSTAGSLVVTDDGPGTFKPEKLASLRTPFRPENGRVTAATSSQLTDGAAALLLMSEEAMKVAGIEKPLARIISSADFSVADSMEFPTAPIGAIKAALQKAQLTIDSIDLFEANEAFAVVPMALSVEFAVPIDKINVLGGALALGHPLGASGARIVGTLITALKVKQKRIGCAAVCNGGGGAIAIIIELM